MNGRILPVNNYITNKITTMQILKLHFDQQNNAILLFTLFGKELIDANKIVRIEALSNYSKIYLSNGKSFVIAKVLRWFEDKLTCTKFIRVHRTHLINKSFMHSYSLNHGAKIILQNGEIISVSRRKEKSVLMDLHVAA